MTDLAELVAALRGSHLKDIDVGGFVDPDEAPLRFYASCRRIFLAFDSWLLQLCTIEDTGRMRLELIAAPARPPELDDDLSFALASVYKFFLRDPDASPALVRLSLWDLDTAGGGTSCAAARFEFANGQELFVDPSYHFGIKLGGSEQEAIWLENAPAAAVEALSVVLGEVTRGDPPSRQG